MQRLFTHVRLGEQETRELMEYLRRHPTVPDSSMLSLCTHSDVDSEVAGRRVFEYEPEPVRGVGAVQGALRLLRRVSFN